MCQGLNFYTFTYGTFYFSNNLKVTSLRYYAKLYELLVWAENERIEKWSKQIEVRGIDVNHALFQF